MAIEGGDPAGCTDPLSSVLTTDQRGSLRPQDGDLDGTAVCDIGAYEAGPPLGTIYAVDGSGPAEFTGTDDDTSIYTLDQSDCSISIM